MEVVEDIVIVGAGIAGLTTSLGLHRLGIRSLVLESSGSLRITGFALTTWTNAWKALDASCGLGDSLRQHHHRLQGTVSTSTISGLQTSEISFEVEGKQGNHEVRCVQRRLLLKALAKELPSGTIRYSSKVVSIEELGFYKLVHLADGTILKTKVLIGCDGVNSVVARWLHFDNPAFTGRSAIRGCVNFKRSHGFGTKFMQFFGLGVRSGFIPCDDNTVNWFFTWTPSSQEKAIEHNPAEMKQFVLSKLGKMPDEVRAIIENTELDSIISSPLRYRSPWELLWGNISKGNVCVAGDALHPMTPDIGQGGCAALEDGVILARCLAEAFLKEPSGETKGGAEIEREREQYKRIEMGLKKYAKERRWRSIELISTAYMVGSVQQANGQVMNLVRSKMLAAFLAGLLLKKADFDRGKLN
ncbi:FAD-dependent urate hydroxylase [Morella rubra]|uniref:FAD-dependent urate hydroxylase n=1 Tax=Morella rubra TaxID=262757 RepID=A0A6A1W6Q3_9ROSI|nr:FAD-dependent urate hydroxylase [Morella rubra]